MLLNLKNIDINIDIALDINKILEPISPDNPAGVEVRFDPAWDNLREAVRADDPLSKLEDGQQLKFSDWELASTLAIELLNQSKDLQVVAWLIQALVELYGVDGYLVGLELLNRFLTQYWESCYPITVLDEDKVDEEAGGGKYKIESHDIDGRINAICYIDKYLHLALLGHVFLEQTENPACTFGQYIYRVIIPEDADTTTRNNLIKQAKTKEFPTSLDIEKYITQIKITYLQDLQTKITACIELTRQVEQTLDTYLTGNHQQGFPTLVKFLKEILYGLNFFLKTKYKPDSMLVDDLLTENDPTQEADYSSLETNTSGDHQRELLINASTAAPVSQNIWEYISPTQVQAQRRKMLDQLEMILKYFQATEPHSPVPYFLHRAIQSAEIPLDKWLSQQVLNPGTLQVLLKNLGIIAENIPNDSPDGI